MYLPAYLGQAQGRADCSGWERDPQSFCGAIAKHYLRTETGQSLQVKRVTQANPTGWYIDFPNKIAVYVTLARVPDFVVAARRYPKPAGPSRFYTYSCTPDGQLVLSERPPP
jgi:hypothetical protein